MEGSCALSLSGIISEPIPDYPDNLIKGYCSGCGKKIEIQLEDNFNGKESR